MRDWIAEVRERLAAAPEAGALPREVVEEVAQHIADVHRAALFHGASDEEADARVELEFANIRDLAQAFVRRQRTPIPLEPASSIAAGIWRDVVHASRLLRARRGYSAVVVLTLAVGIGACTAVFSLFNALLLGPLPYPDPDRLVLLWETDAGEPNATFIVSYPNYRDWARELESFAALGIWEHRTYNVSASADPEQVPGVRASASLFDVLGVAPALGRTFTAAEDEPGHRVAVISDAVWRVHFAAAPDVIGKSMHLNGSAYEVIGLMPRGFAFPRRGTGVWTPFALTAQDRGRASHSFHVAARLREGITFEQAHDEVERLGETMRQKYEENSDEGATLQRMRDYGMGNTSRILVALSGAVALVLLIACVNVAGLQLALGLTRRREFVTRLALGASYQQLARQVFVEGVLLAFVGGTGGLGLAFVVTQGVDLILSPGFRNLPFRGDVAITLDTRVLAFAMGASVASALLFAFVPLIGLRTPTLQPLLRDADRGTTRIAAATRRALVTAEVALAIIVLSSAGLMIRSVSTLLQVQPGLDPSNVLTMQVALPQADTYGPAERAAFCSNLQREVGSLPGVIRASAISHLPLSGANAGRGFTIEGRPQTTFQDGPSADYRLICPNYFAAMAIPPVAGRDFNERDGREGEPVVIINRSAARLYWPEGNALGQRLKLGGYESRNPWMTVVGVVEDVKHFGLEAEARRELYRPYGQAAWPVMTVVTKTAGEPMAWQRTVRGALTRVEPHLPAANAESMEDVISGSVAWRETPMRLLTGFALVGLLLAGLGVYGVLAYYVSQRTRELGVRVALGATKRELVGLVLKQSAIPLVLGVVLGLVGSVASGRFLTELLYEVRPGDPLVLATITSLLIVVALLSSVIPARRAAMVDPLTALREE
jgi:putative ABC transport system permease protein